MDTGKCTSRYGGSEMGGLAVPEVCGQHARLCVLDKQVKGQQVATIHIPQLVHFDLKQE